jgi:NAD(P)H-dependent FMN reductase
VDTACRNKPAEIREYSMIERTHVLLVSGSTRSGSVNAAALTTAAAVAPRRVATVLGFVGAAIIETACRHIPVDRAAIGPDGAVTGPRFHAEIARVWDALLADIDQRAAASAE